MLSVLIVGGGPTGVEFAGELSDLINKDLMRIDPERAADMRYTHTPTDRHYALLKCAQALLSCSRPINKLDACQ